MIQNKDKRYMIAIDLGSNSLRVLAYDCHTHKEIASYMSTVKTADGLVNHGRITAQAVQRIISALNDAKQTIDFTSHEIVAVTTEALRKAKNAKEVLRTIKEKTDVMFEIISGEKEAKLTLLAVKNRLDRLQHATKSFVTVDIGGGSTELIFHYATETISKSFPIGIVTMAQKYDTLEKIQAHLPSEIDAMQKFCTQIYANNGKPQTFVATAGTPTTIAAMKIGLVYETYDAKKINGTSLKLEELDIYLMKLLAMTEKEREITVGTGRSDLIMAGILIYKAIYKILTFDTCIVVDDGLREGVALHFCTFKNV